MAASSSDQARVLRGLYFKLMFRGPQRRSGRPKKNVQLNALRTMWVSMVIFALVGCTALAFFKLGFTGFAGSLHGLTFMLVGMSLASSSGNLLFNKEEADVLMHRPVDPKALLGAKLRVIVQVSLALALAINLCGFVVGVMRTDGSWLFIPAHLISVTLEVIFCASFIALAYNLCLRWFGRERLENLMTGVQVTVAMSGMIISQVAPRFIGSLDHVARSTPSFWMALLPPAWFGSLDAVLTGHDFSKPILALAGLGVGATLLCTWLAVGRMSASYELGLVALNEAGKGASTPGKPRGRWIAALLDLPLVRWWVHDPIERAAFRLTAANLTRARGIKLRVFPSLAQFMIMPLVMMGSNRGSDFNSVTPYLLAFGCSFISLLPTMVIDILRMAEDWQASELFHQAPIARPAALFQGTRKAIVLILSVPGQIILALLGLALLKDKLLIAMILPGAIAMPVFSLAPGLGRSFLPFSVAPENNLQNARGCLTLALFMFMAAVLAGLSGWTWSKGWFVEMLGLEIILSATLSWNFTRAIDREGLTRLR